MVLKRTVWVCCLASVVFTAATRGERVTCTVNVVDLSARPVAGAEVVVYERQTDWTLQEEKPVILFGPETTGPDGRVQASFDCKRASYVMAVACKAGHALGWDVQPYEDTAAPNLLLILDKPVPFAGRVLDAAGWPAAGAKVLAQPKLSKMDRLEQTPVLGPEAWMSVQTDADGRFRLDCFGEDVRCDFFVTAAGSETTYHFTPYYMSSNGYVIGGGDVDLRLPEETAIRGRVVDEAGKGIGGMGVRISRNQRDEGYYKNNYVSRYQVTDAEGRFVFEGMPKVNHILSVLNTDVSRPWAGKSLVVDGAGEAAGDLTVPLEAGGVVEVTLIDEASKKPIEGMTAAFIREPANDKEWWSYRYLSTDAEGRVKVVLPTGAVRFSCWDDRYQRNNELTLPEVKGGESTVVQFELTPYPVMTGVVKDADGKAAAGTAVRLMQGPQVLTNEQGGFRFPVDQIAEGACLAARDVKRNLACLVPAGDPVKAKTLELKPGRTIRGTVTDTEGAPIAAARVMINFDWPGHLGILSEEVLTDAEGKFEVRAIPGDLPEKCEFRISVVTMNHGVSDYNRLSIQREDGEVIELTPIEMAPANRVVSGTVVDAEGKPVAGLPIYLNGGKGQYGHSVVTDGEGRFEMRRICQGEVHLQAGIGGEPGYMTAHSGDTEIKIVMGQRLVHVPQVSLAGKPLGDLAAHGVELSAEAKAVALFVWDVNQRSSRHFVRAFAEKVPRLKEKGVAAVLLQAGPTDRPSLDAWLKENGIDCPCGMIEGDAEAVKAAMGVQGLPWLVLTNGEGTVVAEGFTVDELEERLGSL